MTEEPKRAGRINSFLGTQMGKVLDEIHKNVKQGMKDLWPEYNALVRQAKLHSEDYKISRKMYDDEQKAISKRYHVSDEPHKMNVPEALERIQSTMNLLNRIGSFRLSDREPVPEEEEANVIIIDYFEYDVSDVSDTEPLVKALTTFYYRELKDEFIDRSDVLRRREAGIRAKRAYIFYVKYKEYEESSFDPRKIEEIFGIDAQEEKFLKYWLDELLYNGQATIVFASAGSGKSNIGAFVSQLVLILRPEWKILTNLPFAFSADMQKYMADEYDDAFETYRIDKVILIDKMGNLLMETARIMLKDENTAVILDEFDSALAASQSNSNKGISFQAYTWVERHLGTKGPLLIYHRQASITKPMRDSSTTHQVFGVYPYRSRNRRYDNRRAISRPDFWQYGKRYLPPPITSLAYHNKGWSSFDIDVDMQWLNANIGNVPPKEAARRMLKLIPERGWEKKDEKKSGKGKDEKTDKGTDNRNPDAQPSPS